MRSAFPSSLKMATALKPFGWTFATAVQLLLAGLILLAVRQGTGDLGGAFRSPPWLWVGGLMGLLIVFTVTFAQPRIGATATIGILIAGQLTMGAAIDRFGLFGVDQIAISWPRAVGIGLLRSAQHCRSSSEPE